MAPTQVLPSSTGDNFVNMPSDVKTAADMKSTAASETSSFSNFVKSSSESSKSSIFSENSTVSNSSSECMNFPFARNFSQSSMLSEPSRASTPTGSSSNGDKSSSHGISSSKITNNKEHHFLETQLNPNSNVDKSSSNGVNSSSNGFNSSSNGFNSSSNGVCSSKLNKVKHLMEAQLNKEASHPDFSLNFGQDDFFERMNNNFTDEMEKVMNDWNQSTINVYGKPGTDKFRGTRLNNKMEEFGLQDQLSELEESSDNYKVKVDVSSFGRNSIAVRAVNNDELLIEGKEEKKNGSSESSSQVSRRFCLPGAIKPEEVKSVLSADGILTITAPKQRLENGTPIQNGSDSQTRKETFNKTSSIQSHSAPQMRSFISEESEISQSSNTTKQNPSNLQNLCRKYIKEESSSSSSMSSKSDTENPISNKLNEFFPDESFLSIGQKGNFFSDPFFRESRKHYEEAINKVLQANCKDMSHSAVSSGSKLHAGKNTMEEALATYKNLRNTCLRDDTQACEVIEDDRSYKIVLDISDFGKDSVHIKLMDDKELVVEGQVEKAKKSSSSKQQFKRTFLLPDMNACTIKSVMSTDGILTISAEKRQSNEALNFQNISAEKRQSNEALNFQNVSAEKRQSNEALNFQDVSAEKRQSKEAMNFEAVSAEVCNTCKNTSTKQSLQSASESISSKCSSFSERKIGDNEAVNVKVAEELRKHTKPASPSKNDPSSCSEKMSTSETSVISGNATEPLPASFLSISQGGLFNNDPFFEEARQSYYEAVNKFMKSSPNIFTEDIINTPNCNEASGQEYADKLVDEYQKFQKFAWSEDNQVSAISDHGSSFKVALDVREFDTDCLKVQAVGDRDLLVEGTSQTTAGGTTSMKSFKRSFTLPQAINVDSVTSAMSSDGVLTITASKKLEN